MYYAPSLYSNTTRLSDLTSLLLLNINQFPAPSPAHELALSPPFVRSISTYISHLDPSVRRCGMLVAEEVARGKWKGRADAVPHEEILLRDADTGTPQERQRKAYIFPGKPGARSAVCTHVGRMYSCTLCAMHQAWFCSLRTSLRSSSVV